jgi:hypothetical protein
MIVHRGKERTDRVTRLPAATKEALVAHLVAVRRLTAGVEFLRADHPESLRGITPLEGRPGALRVWKPAAAPHAAIDRPANH